VGDEPFAVMLGDDMMVDDAKLLKGMLAVHERTGKSVVALMKVSDDEISSYGCVDPGEVDGDLVTMAGIVEKPEKGTAPSNLAVIGRYVFSPDIFDCLEDLEPGAGGEIQLTDAIARLIERDTVYGLSFTEGRYDIGKKIDFLRATVELALDRPDLGAEFGELLGDIVRRRGL
jgi:UTP--glucose-1-phosphate uridylyltransferase